MTELLLRYILHEASQEEMHQVETWIAQDDDNRKEYERYLLLWEHSKAPQGAHQPDVEEGWQSLKAKIETTKDNKIAFQPKRKSFGLKYAVAAAVLVILTVTGINYFGIFSKPATWTAQNEAINITLPDNSTIVLNKNSTLALNKNFNQKNRKVTLEGEAFFDVQPDKEKTFIITANDVEVAVLGTSFNVKANKKFTEILVETGSVSVKKNKDSIHLKPDEKATYLSAKKQPIIENVHNTLYKYYRTSFFNCNNTPLYQLTEILSEAYNTPITINNHKLSQQPLTAKFRATDSLESILDKVAATLNAQIEKSGNTYILH